MRQRIPMRLITGTNSKYMALYEANKLHVVVSIRFTEKKNGYANAE